MARECSRWYATIGSCWKRYIAKKNCLVEDGTLIKVLFYNIVQQTTIPAGISAVDDDNCYKWIAHLIASLLFQSLGVLKEVCVSIF
jgi:hypothetical protein